MRWIHGRGRVMVDENGRAGSDGGTAQDITERKRVDELRDSILSAVSHELRTPLTSILGFAVTLKEKGAALAERTRADMVDHLVEQAPQARAAPRRPPDLDRLRHGFVRPSFRATEVRRARRPRRPDLVSGAHAIEGERGAAVAEVDAPKVERIVDNLLANAVSHTPPGTEIVVRVVQPQDGGVPIAVDDRGPGVAERSGRRSSRSSPAGTASDPVPGIGIGLSLVAQFTALARRAAWVEESPGGGASFRVLLPARRAG